jgi:hypothetical protein
MDRSDATVVTWRRRGNWHRLVFEPQHDGSFRRIEQSKHAHSDTWRTHGQEIVAELDVDRPVATSDAGP